MKTELLHEANLGSEAHFLSGHPPSSQKPSLFFSFPFFKGSSKIKFSNRNTYPGEIKTPVLNGEIQDISGN